MSLHLLLLLPGQVLLDTSVRKVRATGTQGSFTLLPRHQDWVSVLRPGLLGYLDQSDIERQVAVDSGVLVKCAEMVQVVVRRAVLGDDLATLQRTVEQEFMRLDEHNRATRDALARLESGVVRRFAGAARW